MCSAYLASHLSAYLSVLRVCSQQLNPGDTIAICKGTGRTHSTHSSQPLQWARPIDPLLNGLGFPHCVAVRLTMHVRELSPTKESLSTCRRAWNEMSAFSEAYSIHTHVHTHTCIRTYIPYAHTCIRTYVHTYVPVSEHFP